jgi:polyphenol oxidase
MSADFLAPLRTVPGICVDFIERVPELPMDADRDEAMRRLRYHHTSAVESLGFTPAQWWRAEQVHGTEIGIAGESATISGAIWLADRVNGAIGLLHSGKKGTEGNILGRAVQQMQENFGSQPENLIAVLGPCIRPPHYEIDFAAEIGRQAAAAGIRDYHDCKTCTASDLHRYYSYRKELGRTGRMMALIGSPLHS